MNYKPTVTIGIPAYNEEANISHLLIDLLEQKERSYELKAIIVVCDGSTDRTEHEALSVQSEKLTIISFASRQGIARAQNEIFKRADTDICVLFDADVRLENQNTLQQLLVPIISGNAAFTSGSMLETLPETFLEKVLWVSMRLKDTIFSSWRKGDNIYTCNGKIRAFSRELYKQLHFPYSLGEDAYSYLFAVYNKFIYRYVPQAKVIYKLPDTLSDHAGQSLRFLESKERYITAFGSDFVKREYAIPLHLYAFAFIKMFIRNPVLLSYYLYLKLRIRFSKEFHAQDYELWSVATSSKQVRLQA
jgi:poly-beta-1,6-N-acetyl-D-glucosamine synthase